MTLILLEKLTLSALAIDVWGLVLLALLTFFKICKKPHGTEFAGEYHFDRMKPYQQNVTKRTGNAHQRRIAERKAERDARPLHARMSIQELAALNNLSEPRQLG